MAVDFRGGGAHSAVLCSSTNGRMCEAGMEMGATCRVARLSGDDQWKIRYRWNGEVSGSTKSIPNK